MTDVVYCKNPQLDGMSNLLRMRADELPSLSETFVDFSQCESLDAVVQKLQEMDKDGLHLTNDRGWVFSSQRLSEVVENIQGIRAEGLYPSLYIMRLLTRTCGLRQRVYDLILED